jgi:hypothetical protein
MKLTLQAFHFIYKKDCIHKYDNFKAKKVGYSINEFD